MVGLERATFRLKDKRERLSAKIPDRKWSDEEYKFLDDAIVDKDMQEAYGRCFGVPGVCVQGKQVRAAAGERSDESGNLLYYCYRFSSAITRVDRIQVKMTAGEISSGEKIDGWTTVYQREKPGDGSTDDWPGPYPRWKPGIDSILNPAGDVTTINGLLDDGCIKLRWDIAKQGGRRENNMNEVRMDGVFIDKKTPLEIIKDIMYRYSGVPYDALRYDTVEIERELGPLNHEIGIMFDKPALVYEAIEKLQGGCVLGFQFHVYRNRFTARLDNPNREEGEDIPGHEILNLDEVEVDWNADLYGSYTDIGYAYNYGEKDWRHWIDKTKRLKILEPRRVEKEWKNDSLLAEKDDAELKSNILLEDFVGMHPVIKNIMLAGEKWHDLRVYDIRHIDFRLPGEEIDRCPHNLIRLIELAGGGRLVSSDAPGSEEYVTVINDAKESRSGREFAGRVRCQVLRVALDPEGGVTTIDVRVKEESKIWE